MGPGVTKAQYFAGWFVLQKELSYKSTWEGAIRNYLEKSKKVLSKNTYLIQKVIGQTICLLSSITGITVQGTILFMCEHKQLVKYS